MGYTHFWTLHPNADPRAWREALCRVVPAVLATTSIPTEVRRGRELEFNGTGPCEGGRAHCDGECGDTADHEPFRLPLELPKEGDWVFCKTGAKEYDVVVSAILAALEATCPDAITVESDGGLADWKPGLCLASQALGTPIPAPHAIR